MRIVQIKTTASHTHTDVERGPSWDGNAVAALMVWRLVNPQKTELLSLALSLIPNRQVMLQDMGIGANNCKDYVNAMQIVANSSLLFGHL